MTTTISAQRWARSPRIVKPEAEDEWRVDSVRVRRLEDGTLEIRSDREWRPEFRVDVYDGEMRLPLEDLVPMILERLDLAELSGAICADEDARKSVLDSLASYYNDHHIEDADRRHWVAAVKEAIHDRAQDQLIHTLTRIEHAVAQMGYRAMADIAYENVLAHTLIEVADSLKAGTSWTDAVMMAQGRYKPTQDMVDFRQFVNTIGSSHDAWNEARDWWREKLCVLFQHVEVPPLPPESET